MKPLIFTIACANYMAKARVLAATTKRFMPETHCVLVLLERDRSAMGDPGLFDEVVLAGSVGLPALDHFLFRHFVMEASTAIKATCFKYFFATKKCRQVIYLDPDIQVFSRFEEVFELQDRVPAVVTPHLLAPEEEYEAFEGVILSRLKYGLFNLGFIAVNASPEAQRFLDWWEARLFTACYFNHDEGQFFDQRWIDLAITLFDLAILRHPGYNVAYWNISRRIMARHANGYTVNGAPLCFFHFSGTGMEYDIIELRKHAPAAGGLPLELRAAYLEAIEAAGHAVSRHAPWSYDTYVSGLPVAAPARLAFRNNPALRSQISDPYAASDAVILHMHEQLRLAKA